MRKQQMLSLSLLLFPLALVLFEASVYIANDMIQPGMLAVIREFHVDASWVPTSMTGFLLGGAMLPWLVGPLSDHYGRRPVMLIGVLFFIVCCLASLFVHDIVSFMVLRILQGMGLSFISAVGYATIQEAFTEKLAVKVTALMANVALLAPLVGPVAGAALLRFWPWRASFVFIAALAIISFIGLWFSMPETVERTTTPMSLRQMGRDYRAVFGHGSFMASAVCNPLLALPLLGWIALSPVMLVEKAGLSLVQYGLWQFPIFGCLILGNILLVKLTDYLPLGRSVRVGWIPVWTGVAVMLLGAVFSQVPYYYLIAGMSLISLGSGLSFSVLYRFTLTATSKPKGIAAASMTMISMIVYALGIEAMKTVFMSVGYPGYCAMILLAILCYHLLSRRVVRAAMAERAHGGHLADNLA